MVHLCIKNTPNISLIQTNFAIFPNPTKKLVNLRLEIKDGEEIIFELHDIVGKKIMGKRLSSGLLHGVDINSVQHGIYLYRLIKNEEVLQSGKLIIE
tara:strand:+ start:210 stop:500 length:291 start_codon:yes stop_codon:yes gene_type:complete